VPSTSLVESGGRPSDRRAVNLEDLVPLPGQLAVKWPEASEGPEASEALTRTPPIDWGDTSVPGDRAHPGPISWCW